MTRDWLVARLGREAECAFRARCSGDITGDEPAGLIAAAVLVPVVERDDSYTVLFTRRTEGLRHHAGQISFPGGRVEATDRSPEETALRETREEIGLTASRIGILGRLERYVTGTGFAVTPVVGLVRSPFGLTLDPSEVAEIFEVPLDFFLEPAHFQRCRRFILGEWREYYAVPWGEYFIWGATAGILKNLHHRLLSE